MDITAFGSICLPSQMELLFQGILLRANFVMANFVDFTSIPGQ